MMVAACCIILLHCVVPHHDHDDSCGGLVFENELTCRHHHDHHHHDGACRLQDLLSQLVISGKDDKLVCHQPLPTDKMLSSPAGIGTTFTVPCVLPKHSCVYDDTSPLCLADGATTANTRRGPPASV